MLEGMMRKAAENCLFYIEQPIDLHTLIHHWSNAVEVVQTFAEHNQHINPSKYVREHPITMIYQYKVAEILHLPFTIPVDRYDFYISTLKMMAKGGIVS